MSDICGDNRFELIEKYKKELIEATNIETAPDEMAVLDDILFRFWQMGWLDQKASSSCSQENDVISRKAAIDGFYEMASDMEHLCTVSDYVSFLESLPSAQQWIPCRERLPEEEKKTYWVCTDTEYQCECRWTNNRFGFGEGKWGWSIFDTPQYSKPIAWMPLPEPYKAERKDE